MGENPKTVFITGAAKRIGRELAIAFAQRGYECIVHYHTSKLDAENLIAEITAHGGRAYALSADLENSAAVETVFRQAQEKIGNIGVLINNAALFERDSLDQIDADLFTRHSKINVLAPMLLTEAMYHQKIPQGCVINILDHILSNKPRGYASYAISKAALLHATQLAAAQFYPHLRVNAIAPGIILPPVHEQADKHWRDAYHDPLLDHDENVQDVVKNCLYLASNSALNGQIIPIDSGRHLTKGGILKIRDKYGAA